MTILKRRSFLATGIALVFAPFSGLKAAEPKPCEHDWTLPSTEWKWGELRDTAKPVTYTLSVGRELPYKLRAESHPDFSRKCRKCLMTYLDFVWGELASVANSGGKI